MSVYVDPLFLWTGGYHGKDAAQAARVGGRNGHQWCHLFADEKDSAELHRLASCIGMRREWFQGDHYDLTPGKRTAAIHAGAIEVDRIKAVEIWRKQRGKPARTAVNANQAKTSTDGVEPVSVATMPNPTIGNGTGNP